MEYFTVTWNEIKSIVDNDIKGDEPLHIWEVERAISKAWNTIFDERCNQTPLSDDVHDFEQLS